MSLFYLDSPGLSDLESAIKGYLRKEKAIAMRLKALPDLRPVFYFVFFILFQVDA